MVQAIVFAQNPSKVENLELLITPTAPFVAVITTEKLKNCKRFNRCTNFASAV
jgi:hypothetical protein